MTLRRGVLLLLPFCLVVLLAPLVGKGPDPTRDAPRAAPAFRLSDPRDGTVVDSAGWKKSKAVVVVFLGAQCPLSNDFLPELGRLHGEYAPKGVRFVGVNSNRQDTPAHVAAHARKNAVPFPVVKDPANKAADGFGARRTPEAFLIDPAGKVVYRGRIDDQFGVGYRRAGKPTRRDLAEAIDEVLAGKPVSRPRTEPAGCFIARLRTPKAAGAVTYSKHVAPIVQKHCQGCHREGQIGPMSLSGYDDAVAWAETIREVVSEGRMPPWFADPRHGRWANDRRLSAEEKRTLLAWLDGGTPRGDDALAPPPRKFPEGWQIGKPDVVLTMPRAFRVPAQTPKGGVPYQYFTIPTNFKEDRWVERAEARPGAAAVVHHMLVFLLLPGQVFRPDGPGNVLCGMAPGDMPLVLGPGLAKKVPAGARLLVQMHYTPNGKEHLDRSSVGLIFAKKPPRHRVLTKPVHNGWFMSRLLSIPAGSKNFSIQADHTFREDAHVLAFMPHMHLRGKDFLYEAVYPGGKKETLLSVPRYNFNWQSIYRAEKPLAMPQGTRLHCVAHYDNSAANPHNPDPARRVYWGDQTWEEMMVGWIDYYVDGEKP
jgi:peroxiredoxin